MGSVGPNYKCPLCGRMGNGGYAVETFPFPICTEGDFSCLWFQLVERRREPRDIIANALGRILDKMRQKFPPMIIPIIASFLTPGHADSERLPDSSSWSVESIDSEPSHKRQRTADSERGDPHERVGVSE